MGTQKTKASDWVKEHWWNVLQFLVVMIGAAYAYGTFVSKVSSLENTVKEISVKLEDQIKNGNPEYERRIISLEKRTDDLSSVRQIVLTQSEQIRDLKDIVYKDHDSIMKLIQAYEMSRK